MRSTNAYAQGFHMKYSRPGPTQPETEKIRDRMGGGRSPNAATLPGSEPSAPVIGSGLTNEQQAIADANRLARAANVAAHTAKGTPVKGTPVVPPAPTGAK